MENVSEILSRSVSFKCWWIAIRQHVIKCLTLIKIFICPAWIKKHLLKIHSILAVLLTKAKALSTGTKPALIGPPSLKMSRTSSGSRKDSLYQLSNSATNTKRQCQRMTEYQMLYEIEAYTWQFEIFYSWVIWSMSVHHVYLYGHCCKTRRLPENRRMRHWSTRCLQYCTSALVLSSSS